VEPDRVLAGELAGLSLYPDGRPSGSGGSPAGSPSMRALNWGRSRACRVGRASCPNPPLTWSAGPVDRICSVTFPSRHGARTMRAHRSPPGGVRDRCRALAGVLPVHASASHCTSTRAAPERGGRDQDAVGVEDQEGAPAVKGAPRVAEPRLFRAHGLSMSVPDATGPIRRLSSFVAPG